MAQLIKLEDYISRYEWDAYRYPGQYIRLKQDNWKKLKTQWLLDQEAAAAEVNTEEEPKKEEQREKRFDWNVFRKKREEPPEETEEKPERAFREYLARYSEKDLKHYFLDYLFPIQLKWATSTVTEVSFVKTAYNYDKRLKYLLQRFPDTFLIMYKPVFSIRKAPIDCDTIMITPLGIEILSWVEAPEGTRIIAGDERKWAMESGGERRTILNPVISLRRTEHVVRSILGAKGIDFPIRKTILAKPNQILYATEPYQTDIIDQLRYPEWFEEKRQLRSPLKSIQLRSADALLAHTRTSSVKRPEWEEEKTYLQVGDETEEPREQT